MRKKELGFVVIFARMVLPLVFGSIAGIMLYGVNVFPDWGGMKKLFAFATVVGLSYKGPEIYIQNLISKRTDAVRKGLPDALDLLVICAEAGLTVDAAFNRVARELGRAYPELGDEFALTAIELSFLSERRRRSRTWYLAREAGCGQRRDHHHGPDRALWHAARLRAAGADAEFRNERMMRAEEKAARLPRS